MACSFLFDTCPEQPAILAQRDIVRKWPLYNTETEDVEATMAQSLFKGTTAGIKLISLHCSFRRKWTYNLPRARVFSSSPKTWPWLHGAHANKTIVKFLSRCGCVCSFYLFLHFSSVQEASAKTQNYVRPSQHTSPTQIISSHN